MNRREYENLLAQLGDINQFLAMLPASAVLDRASWEYRKQQVKEELDANPPPLRWPAAARLAFNGPPVAPGAGVELRFGTQAINAFANAVASFGAAQRTPASDHEPIPRRDDCQLQITGTAPGSFAFIIEEFMPPDAPITSESPVGLAFERINAVLQASISSDEELAEATAEIPHRALLDLQKFLRTLESHQAVCSFFIHDSPNTPLRFNSVAEVTQSLNKLEEDNISEREYDIFGRFQGYLPNSRRAEFVNRETREIISGKVAASVNDANRINHILWQDVRLSVRSRVVGTGKPRYTFIGFRTPAEPS